MSKLIVYLLVLQLMPSASLLYLFFLFILTCHVSEVKNGKKLAPGYKEIIKMFVFFLNISVNNNLCSSPRDLFMSHLA